MTRKLESLFGLAQPESEEPIIDEIDDEVTEEEVVTKAVATANKTLEMIADALPAVRELALIDDELDDIAKKAMDSFEDLSDLGMNVDSRFSAEIFSVASSMMGHALSAKTAKANRRLKTIELQMKKIRLELDMQKQVDRGSSTAPALIGPIEQAEGQVLSRNELMAIISGSRATPNTEN